EREGERWRQRYELALPAGPPERVGSATGRGTSVACAPSRGAPPALEELERAVRARAGLRGVVRFRAPTGDSALVLEERPPTPDTARLRRFISGPTAAAAAGFAAARAAPRLRRLLAGRCGRCCDGCHFATHRRRALTLRRARRSKLRLRAACAGPSGPGSPDPARLRRAKSGLPRRQHARRDPRHGLAKQQLLARAEPLVLQ